jgi:hypothetical protein
MDDETKQFLEDLENQYDGKITWKTFATWYGCSDSTFREYGIFMFKINNIFYFEDFEKKHSIFGMDFKPKKKNKVKYVKLKRNIDAENIIKVFKVSQANALQVIKHRKDPSTIEEINLFDKIFKKSVAAVELKDGTYHFFELLNLTDFKKNL